MHLYGFENCVTSICDRFYATIRCETLSPTVLSTSKFQIWHIPWLYQPLHKTHSLLSTGPTLTHGANAFSHPILTRRLSNDLNKTCHAFTVFPVVSELRKNSCVTFPLQAYPLSGIVTEAIVTDQRRKTPEFQYIIAPLLVDSSNFSSRVDMLLLHTVVRAFALFRPNASIQNSPEDGGPPERLDLSKIALPTRRVTNNEKKDAFLDFAFVVLGRADTKSGL
jgi:hypothetical protein